jgi:ketosteroid isomerase-like protein
MRAPDRYRSLLETFARGWEAGDVEAMVSVFADDAVLRETPFAKEDRGIAALRAYWRTLPQSQAEASFKFGEVFEAGDEWFAAEFQLTFRRRRTGERVDARGAMFCETKNAKITEMRMYWHRQAGGREESAD